MVRNSPLMNLNSRLRYRPPSPPFHCPSPCRVQHPSPSVTMVGGSRAPRPQSLLCLAYILAAGFMNLATHFIHHTCAPSSSSIVSLISCAHFAMDTPPRYYQHDQQPPPTQSGRASLGRRPTSSFAAAASQVTNYIYFMNLLAILLTFYLGVQYICSLIWCIIQIFNLSGINSRHTQPRALIACQKAIGSTSTWCANCRCQEPRPRHKTSEFVYVCLGLDGVQCRHEGLEWFGQECPYVQWVLRLLVLPCTGVLVIGVTSFRKLFQVVARSPRCV
jgi:hypothetical protein